MKFLRLNTLGCDEIESFEIIVNPAAIKIMYEEITGPDTYTKIYLTDHEDDTGYSVTQRVNFILAMLG